MCFFTGPRFPEGPQRVFEPFTQVQQPALCALHRQLCVHHHDACGVPSHRLLTDKHRHEVGDHGWWACGIVGAAAAAQLSPARPMLHA